MNKPFSMSAIDNNNLRHRECISIYVPSASMVQEEAVPESVASHHMPHQSRIAPSPVMNASVLFENERLRNELRLREQQRMHQNLMLKSEAFAVHRSIEALERQLAVEKRVLEAHVTKLRMEAQAVAMRREANQLEHPDEIGSTPRGKRELNRPVSVIDAIGAVPPPTIQELNTAPSQKVEDQPATMLVAKIDTPGPDAVVFQNITFQKTKRRKHYPTFEERFKQVQAFRSKFGHCRIPKRENPSLHEWCKTQRKKRCRSAATLKKKKEIDLLETIGFFDPKKASDPMLNPIFAEAKRVGAALLLRNE